MTGQTWSYPRELLEVLEAFGLRPTPGTPPALVRDALNDLYRYELRRLRRRMRDGQVVKTGYADAVIGLRKRYWPLSLQLEHWEIICAGQPPGTGPRE